MDLSSGHGAGADRLSRAHGTRSLRSAGCVLIIFLALLGAAACSTEDQGSAIRYDCPSNPVPPGESAVVRVVGANWDDVKAHVNGPGAGWRWVTLEVDGGAATLNPATPLFLVKHDPNLGSPSFETATTIAGQAPGRLKVLLQPADSAQPALLADNDGCTVVVGAASGSASPTATPTGEANPSEASLLAHWSFDEGTGQVAGDISGHGNNGQLGSTGSADANDPTWVEGKTGASALHFDGDDYVELAEATGLEPLAITVEAWIRQPGSPGSYRYVVAKGVSGCLGASYALYSGGSGGLSFYVFNGSAFAFSPDAGTGVWDGEWHHAVGTFDGSVVRLYVDGVEIGPGTPTEIAINYRLTTHDRMYIGDVRGTCNYPFSGDIDEVKIWSRAMAPSEIGA